MKIALIAPVIRRISVKNSYGGIERIFTSLAFGAANAGHKVVLYAPYGTDLQHDNIEIRLTTDQDVSGKPDLIAIAESNLFQRIIDEQDYFDIIHSHIEPAIADRNGVNYFSKILKPIVITFHNLTYIDERINYYKSHTELQKINFVFISKDQAKPLNFMTNQTVIYNGIDLSDLSFNPQPNIDQLAFLGRITPEKGIAEAITIAKISGKKLFIAAAIDDSERDFYEKNIKPQIDGKQIIYLGEVGNVAKNELLRTSEALLFPIKWHEPFGLVMVESMATGTPVIATDIGSVSEIIEDNKTGFIVPNTTNINDYVNKLRDISNINREYCHQYAETNFAENIMVANYLNYYETLI